MEASQLGQPGATPFVLIPEGLPIRVTSTGLSGIGDFGGLGITFPNDPTLDFDIERILELLSRRLNVRRDELRRRLGMFASGTDSVTDSNTTQQKTGMTGGRDTAVGTNTMSGGTADDSTTDSAADGVVDVTHDTTTDSKTDDVEA